MLKFLRPDPLAHTADILHEAVVVGARRPGLFAELGVPDTPWGRIESIMLHAVLVVRRLRALEPPAADLAQGLTDRMFADFDRGLRDVGVGDLSVPKKMLGLGGDWLGRIEAYAGPLDRGDAGALAAALARNILSRPDEPGAARPLAFHALACEAALAAVARPAFEAGDLAWPPIAPKLRS